MRLLAVTNLLLVAYGILLIVDTGYNLHRYPTLPVPWPYWCMVAINLLFLWLLAYASLLLWRLHSRGLVLCLATLAIENFYFVAVGFIWALGNPFSTQVAAASGIGDMGIAPQVLTGYPLIAGVICVILLFKSPRRPTAAVA